MGYKNESTIGASNDFMDIFPNLVKAIFSWFIIANKSLVRFWKSDGSIKFTFQMHVYYKMLLLSCIIGTLDSLYTLFWSNSIHFDSHWTFDKQIWSYFEAVYNKLCHANRLLCTAGSHLECMEWGMHCYINALSIVYPACCTIILIKENPRTPQIQYLLGSL